MKEKHAISSLTIQGLLLTALMFCKTQFGWDFSEAGAEQAVTVLLQVAGIVIAFLGRYRHGNLRILPKPK